MPPYRPVSRLILPSKADPAAPLRLLWDRELPNRFDQLPDGLVVGADFLFRFSEFAGQFLVGSDQVTPLDEGGDDVDAQIDRARTCSG